MAHELDFTTGKAAIAYKGEVPWHGYGAPMQDNQTLEEWRIAAGLDYEVQEYPLFYRNGQDREIGQYKALVRSDTMDAISVVGHRYKSVQPKAVLEFFRDLVERQGFEIETAGALANGRRVWALARIGQDLVLPDDDKLLGYLLLATSYDAKFATTAQLTGVRVVCNNTLTAALANESGRPVRVTHSQDFDAASVKFELGLVDEGWHKFSQQIRTLTQVPVSPIQAMTYYLELANDTTIEDPDIVDFAEEADSNYKYRLMYDAYKTSPGQQLSTARGTAWGLVNGVTYFTDHQRRARNAGTRMNSAWFGESAVLKKKAFDKALALAA